MPPLLSQNLKFPAYSSWPLERLDMLLNDSMYGILFRDINMRRTFVD